jgi:hypothetical protein
MNITPLFVPQTPVEGQPMHTMNTTISVSIRKTKNGANVTVSGLGVNEEYSVEQKTAEAVVDFADRVKTIITDAIEAV